jgi:ABC-2 type transport system ATP-binding protein
VTDDPAAGDERPQPAAPEAPPPTDTPEGTAATRHAPAEAATASPPPAEAGAITPTGAEAPAAFGQAAVGQAAAGPAVEPIVVVEGVTRAFDNRAVVRDLDLTIERGTVVGVIGPSGSGKTTTVRMLTGALRPTKGRIRVLGENPTSFRRGTRERIGYMPQLFTLYPDLTARENVDFVGSLFGMLWRRRRKRSREVLELLDLWPARDRRASAMSGGMQRRLELACALIHEPVLLFLDEPTAGIDPILRAKVWDELHRLRDAGRTILVTTQYVGDAEDCDRVALIARGRLIAFAPPEELRRNALGGDVIEVETASLFDASTVQSVPGVVSVNQRGPRAFSATVEDSASALPAVVDAVTGSGAEVTSAQEVRPTFDDVFALLVERAEAEDAETADADQEPAA